VAIHLDHNATTPIAPEVRHAMWLQRVGTTSSTVYSLSSSKNTRQRTCVVREQR
jgi:cysteine sulfinate desulfinase/cysteine desulfurase-like protein